LKFFVRQPTSIETVIGVNWLECNGAAVSRSTYSDLYTLLNAMRFARGSGSSTLAALIDSLTTTITIPSPWPTTWPGGTASEFRHQTLAGGSANDAIDMPFLIQIDSEKMLVTSRGAFPYTSLTVVRGREGTLATSHVLNAPISLAADLPFGSGDGATTFNLLDLHGRSPIAAARPGGHADVLQVGRHDRASLDSRRPRHRHSWESGAAGSGGSQVPFAGGTLGSGRVGSGSGSGTWAYQDFGIRVGPATGFEPLDSQGYVVAGVWGIRFVG